MTPLSSLLIASTFDSSSGLITSPRSSTYLLSSVRNSLLRTSKIVLFDSGFTTASSLSISSIFIWLIFLTNKPRSMSTKVFLSNKEAKSSRNLIISCVLTSSSSLRLSFSIWRLVLLKTSSSMRISSLESTKVEICELSSFAFDSNPAISLFASSKTF